MPEEVLPIIDPVEAIAFFRAKGWSFSFDWRDVWQEEHGRAFTVAKAMSRDLLEDIRAAVDQSLGKGETLQQFVKELRPRLVARGWWGRRYMTDPQTGESKVVQLGSPARLRTIYETNLRTSYMAGRWQRIERTKATLPLLRYVSVMDGRERPEHHAWHDTILPVDDPWWDTHFPPCGWGCRCDTQPLNQRMLARKGWAISEPPRFPERDYVNKRTGEVTRLERGIDPGWSYNVGKAALDGLTPEPRLKPIAGEGGELQAAFSAADYALVRGFFAAFGLKDRKAAGRGIVWKDATGWPLAISLGLFRGADGAMVRPSSAQAQALKVAARVLNAPDRIGLVWVAGKDGRAMLVRRYSSAAGVVDMARDFWRWQAGPLRGIDRGHLIWARHQGELAAYDPGQLRDEWGRWMASGRGAALKAIGDAQVGSDIKPFKSATVGRIRQEAADRAHADGVDIKGRVVRLTHSAAVHVFNNPGPVATAGTTERAMRADDLLSVHSLISRAHRFVHKGIGMDNQPRFEAFSSDRNGLPIKIVADVSPKRVTLVTMMHQTEGGRKRRQRQKRKRRK